MALSSAGRIDAWEVVSFRTIAGISDTIESFHDFQTTILQRISYDVVHHVTTTAGAPVSTKTRRLSVDMYQAAQNEFEELLNRLRANGYPPYT